MATEEYDHSDMCVICGGTRFVKVFQGRDRLHGLPGEFTLGECKTCGLLTVHPRLSREESANYYPDDYISYPQAIEDEPSWFRRLDRGYGIRKRCQPILKRVRTPGKILDIGCATGVFLNGMRRYGWDCYGVEPSAHAAEYARNRFGLNITNGYLDDIEFPEGYFDVITLWDVVEHLPDPLQSLKKIRYLLKPGGWLVLSLPNTLAWERYWFKEYWAGWDIPRHYNMFSPQTIGLLLKKCDFKTMEIKSFTGRHGALVISISFLLSDSRLSLRAKKTILDILQSFPLRVLTLPFYMVADAFNRSTIMTVFAQ